MHGSFFFQSKRDKKDLSSKLLEKQQKKWKEEVNFFLKKII